jgi:hypothetical protein
MSSTPARILWAASNDLNPDHGTRDPFCGSMILLHDIMQIFYLADDNGGAMFLVVALDRGFVRVAAVNGDRLGEPVAADRLLEKP